MSVEEVKGLEAEYQRLKDAALKVVSEGGQAGWYQATQMAREQVREFCLTTGKDITVLAPVFNAEDLGMANVGS
jgi:hypothetical protein